MVLVNGANGIGTGWSTSIPNYNPMDIISGLKSMLKEVCENGKTTHMLSIHDVPPMVPWYNGFNGSVSVVDQKETKSKGRKRQTDGTLCEKYNVQGSYEWVDEEQHREENTIGDTIHIIELPIGKWVNDYKQFLEEGMELQAKKTDTKKGKGKKGKGKKKKGETKDDAMDIDDEEEDDAKDEDFNPEDEKKKSKSKSNSKSNEQTAFLPGDIVDLRCNHTDTTVSFTVKLSDKFAKMLWKNPERVIKLFKLNSIIDTGNMHAFNMNGNITRYANEREIMLEFFKLRLSYYYKRKEDLLSKLSEDYKKVDNKVRFILAIINDELIINKRKKVDLIQQLRDDDYYPIPPKSKNHASSNDNDDDDDEDQLNSKDFDYLLSMPLWNLTMEKVNKLEAERDEKAKQGRCSKAKKRACNRVYGKHCRLTFLLLLQTYFIVIASYLLLSKNTFKSISLPLPCFSLVLKHPNKFIF